MGGAWWSRLIPSWEQIASAFAELAPLIAALLGYQKGGSDANAKTKADQSAADVEGFKRVAKADADMRSRSHDDLVQYLRDNGLL